MLDIMENNTHHQCSLCLNLNNQLSNQSKHQPYVSNDISGLFLPKPIVIYHDLVSNMNSYFNYLNLINKSVIDRNDYSNRFIQIVNRDNDILRQSQMPRHNHIQFMEDSYSNKAGVLLCTCNEFINNTLQRRDNHRPYSSLLSKSLHLQSIPQTCYLPINTTDQSNFAHTNFPSTSSNSIVSTNTAPIKECTVTKQSLLHYPQVTQHTHNISGASYNELCRASVPHPAFNQSQPLFPAQRPIKTNNQSNTRSFSIGSVLSNCHESHGTNNNVGIDSSNSNHNNQYLYKSSPGINIIDNDHEQNDFGSIKSFAKTLDESSTISEFNNSIYSTTSMASEPMCRFCHLSKQTIADPLISPCLCSGTLKLVHQNCLKTWLDVSKKQRANSNAPDKSPHCELCNFKYVRKRKFQCGSLRYPKLSQNDCALHLIFLCSLLVMLTSASVTILCFAMEKSSTNFFNPSIRDKFVFSNLRHKWTMKKQSIAKYKIKTLQYLIKCQRQFENSTKARNKTCDLKKPSLPNKKPTRNKFGSNPAQRGSRLWILSPEEAVTLASGVIFFIAFFIAMVVQVKSSYTCYQLILQWIRLNYVYEVQPLRPVTPPPLHDSVSLKLHRNSANQNSRHQKFPLSHKMRRNKSLSQCCMFTSLNDLTDRTNNSNRNNNAEINTNNTAHNANFSSSSAASVVVVSSHSSSVSIAHNNRRINTLQRPREYIERCVTEI